MKACSCRVPISHPNPNKAHQCVRCARLIAPEWSSNDKTVGEFFDRLKETIPNAGDGFRVFRAECEGRERAGRKTFGHRHLGRENTRDAREEFGDGALYALFDTLQARRDGRGDEDYETALEVAYHAYRAHEAAQRLRHKRQGDP